ncbi:MAG: hypothetical protein ACLQJF_03855, partial [Candidatus Sulfotelmatobacter sp.]
QCTAPRVHPDDSTPRLFFFQAKIRLHPYTRQRPPRKRLRSDALVVSNRAHFWIVRKQEVIRANCEQKLYLLIQ